MAWHQQLASQLPRWLAAADGQTPYLKGSFLYVPSSPISTSNTKSYSPAAKNCSRSSSSSSVCAADPYSSNSRCPFSLKEPSTLPQLTIQQRTSNSSATNCSCLRSSSNSKSNGSSRPTWSPGKYVFCLVLSLVFFIGFNAIPTNSHFCCCCCHTKTTASSPRLHT